MRSGRAILGWSVLGLLWSAGQAQADSPEGRLEVPYRPAPFVGVLVASRVLDVVPRVEGRLETMKVRLGEHVTEGQLLAVLELQPFQLELAAREATVHASAAEENRAALLLEQSRQRAERERRILEYSAAESLETAETQVALSQADLASARARAAEARVRQEQAARDLEQSRLKALFSGVVTELYMQPGAMVSRSTPVLRLVSEELRLRFAVPEAASRALKLGSRVKVRLESQGITLTGTVDHISPEIDPLSRHQKMEARLDIPAALRGHIPTGLMADVEALPADSASATP
jgi:membrane fusion protein, multidrug efflux system